MTPRSGSIMRLRIMGLIQSSPETSTPVSLVSLDGADHLLGRNAIGY